MDVKWPVVRCDGKRLIVRQIEANKLSPLDLYGIPKSYVLDETDYELPKYPTFHYYPPKR